MDIDKLVRMANQIAANYEYLPDPDAAGAKVADHIRRFWDPGMRSEIIEYLHADGSDLSDIARRAITKIENAGK